MGGKVGVEVVGFEDKETGRVLLGMYVSFDLVCESVNAGVCMWGGMDVQ